MEWLARTGRVYGIERANATNASDFQSAAAGITVSADGLMATNIPSLSDAEFFRVTVRDASGW